MQKFHKYSYYLSEHSTVLQRSLDRGEPELFYEHLRWTRLLFSARGLKVTNIAESLEGHSSQAKDLVEKAAAGGEKEPVEIDGRPLQLTLPVQQDGQGAADVIEQSKPDLAAYAMIRHYMRRPEDAGRRRHDLCLQDFAYHFSYLEEALRAESPELFRDYLQWAQTVLERTRISNHEISGGLDSMRLCLEECLTGPPQAEALKVLKMAREGLQKSTAGQKSYLCEDSTLATLAAGYLDRLMEGDRRGACRLILDAVEDGARVEDVYLEVFQPTQYEVGRLWQRGEISIAKEHFCTAVTQMVMSQLYPYFEPTNGRQSVVVATAVGSEMHEIGIRMVCDLMELDGWTTYYLGANTPTESIIQSVVERQADLLAISVTMTFHLNHLKELIQTLRDDPRCRDLKIVVGGYPFRVDPQLWRVVGADGGAPDARAAVDMAGALVN